MLLYIFDSASAQLTIILSDRLTVCPTVRHTLVSCQNDSSYDHAVFTGGQPHDSSFLTVNFTAKFQREHRERGRRMREGEEKCSKNRQFLANKSPYLRNGARQDHSHNDRLIGSRIRAFDWYQNHRPWMTLNDLERPKRTLVQKRCVFWSPLHKFE